MAGLGLALLRLTVAVVLLAHGAHQLFGVLGGSGAGSGGLAATSAYFEGIGLTHPMALAVLAGVLQLVGGALIAVGFLTRWASLALIGYIGFLGWKDHLRWGFFMNWVLDPTRGHGVEYSVLIVGTLVCLTLAGAGDLSIDGRSARRAAARASGRARLRSRD
jgi:putative oxidoreductase